MSSLPNIESWNEGTEEDITVIPNCLCPSCNNSNAITTLLPTKIPLFREIIIMTLRCDDCNFRNTEVTFGGEIQKRGATIRCHVASSSDLNRQLIKSDSCTLTIPNLEFEIPPHTQRGSISTIEGVLLRAAENLEVGQAQRLEMGDLENFYRCKGVIDALKRLAGHGEEEEEGGTTKEFEPFEIVLDDPAGNSFIENPHAPQPDPHLHTEWYYRTPTQDMGLGLQPSQAAVDEGIIDDNDMSHKNATNVAKGSHHPIDAPKHDNESNLGRDEALKFPTTCPHCHADTETTMCVTDIPHFKEVVIMSLLCDQCGYKSNEIKGGGAIPQFGTKIELSVTSEDDLAREVLKSDTAGIELPELELVLQEGGLDGVYTTVEGLLHKMHERLLKANPFGHGDSSTKHHLMNDGGAYSQPSPNYVKFMAFLEQLKDMADGKRLPFTLIINDPLSNSFVGPIPRDAIQLSLQAEKEGSHDCYDKYVDRGMEIEEYERTEHQNEMLGLLDMKTENYGEQHQENYGTDKAEPLPDRLKQLDLRGPDHPLIVGKAPVEGDTTIMGPGSFHFAVPGMAKRGKEMKAITTKGNVADHKKNIFQKIHEFERQDSNFRMNEEWEGTIENMVFKDGAQGLGYYTDKPLKEILGKES